MKMHEGLNNEQRKEIKQIRVNLVDKVVGEDGSSMANVWSALELRKIEGGLKKDNFAETLRNWGFLCNRFTTDDLYVYRKSKKKHSNVAKPRKIVSPEEKKPRSITLNWKDKILNRAFLWSEFARRTLTP